MAGAKKHIVVIGAGVVGLQTAVSLLETGRYAVTIVAGHFPGDRAIEYTSPWAGAQWRTHAAAGDAEQCGWDVLSYARWYEMVLGEQSTASARSGLGIYESVFYSEEAAPPWFAKDVEGFGMLEETLGIGGRALTGYKYESIMINAPMYLDHLQARAITLGALTLRAALPTPSALAATLEYTADLIKHSSTSPEAPISAFVNATGIGARELVPDHDVFAIRGQTVTVRGEASRITTVDAAPDDPTPASPNITYILPRPHSGTTILGGTRQAGNWSGEVDPRTTREILERARRFAPELLDAKGEFEVLSEQVGLRPGRKGGARVEIEELGSPAHTGRAVTVVCHTYGHAGAGYQNSIGSAGKVVRLLGEYFEQAAKAKL